MNDYLVLTLVGLFLCGMAFLVYLFFKWTRAKGLSKEVRSERAKKLVFWMGIYWVIINGAAIVLNGFSFSEGKWRKYFWLLFGALLIWTSKKESRSSILEGLAEDDRKELSAFWKTWPMKAAFGIFVLVGLIFFKVIEKSKNPLSLLILIFQFAPFLLLSWSYKKRVNALRKKRGLVEV